jgi:hypothetical protein
VFVIYTFFGFFGSESYRKDSMEIFWGVRSREGDWGKIRNERKLKKGSLRKTPAKSEDGLSISSDDFR